MNELIIKSNFSNSYEIYDENSIIYFNLQLFAEDSPTGQKTEPATERRRRKAREEGMVARSNDLSAMIIVTTCIVVIYFSFNFSLNSIIDYLKTVYSNPFLLLNEVTLNRMIINFLNTMWIAIFPTVIAALLSALIINFYQVGFYFSTESLMLNLQRFNPINGLAKLFSKEPIVELIKSIFKVLVVIYIPYQFFKENITSFSKFIGVEINQILPIAMPMLFSPIIKIIVILIVLALIDYIYQYFEFEKKIMMSKYDIKKEFKEEEGDPLIKQEIRRRARKIALGQMLNEVPKAKVVITNPTHISIALAYDGGSNPPKVVAKGIDFIALKIREIAQKNNVPIYEDRLLARELYDKVEIGQFIPEEFYQAVATVLAFVFQKSKR